MTKLRLLIVLLSVAFITGFASATVSYNWVGNTQANWDSLNWTDELGNFINKPDGQYEVKIKEAGSIVTVNTVEGNWDYTGNGSRLRVYKGATLNVVDGGELRGFGWIRIGEQTGNPEQIGYLNQSGGTILLRNLKEGGKLSVGDGYGLLHGSTYTMSGGTLTYDVADPACDGQLIIGSRDGEGTFTVIGNSSVIHMKNLYVAGDNSNGVAYNNGIGTLKFMVGADGVSPIVLDSTAYIDQGLNTVANLVVSLTNAPPIGQDILLVDAAAPIHGFFDTLNGGAANEGASVSLSFGEANYNYTLTYAGGNDNKDIALLWVPEPATVALFALGGLLSIKRRR